MLSEAIKTKKLQEQKDLAAQRGGKCLSTEYINDKTKLQYECSKGHIFYIQPNCVKIKHQWCRKCFLEKPRLNESDNLFYLQRQQQIAQNKNCKLLSTEWKGNRSKYTYECSKGHIFSFRIFEKTDGCLCVKCKKIEENLIKYNNHLQLVESKGGKLLSDKWLGTNVKHNYTCKNNHVFDMLPSDVISGHWCRFCAFDALKVINTKELIIKEPIIKRDKKLDQLNIQIEIAKSYNGNCLSDVYINNRTKLQYVCKNNHIFWAIPDSVKCGHWCPQCAIINKKLSLNKRQIALERQKQIAIKQNGKCISTEYINSKTDLEFECNLGHVFLAQPNQIVQGRWCPFCAGKHVTIKEFQEIANNKNGICLSTEYIDSKNKLQFHCNLCNNDFWANPQNIKNNHWCPTCANLKRGESQRDCIEKFINIAQERNGICLSTEYKNSSSKLKYFCNKCKNIFVQKANCTKIGHWCPICSQSKGERCTKYAIEVLTGLKFEKIKPDWLKNPNSNYPLELDMYNEKYNLGVEHQGTLHFFSINHFGGEKEFEKRQKRDEIKYELCKQNNTKLIYVPDVFKILGLNNLRQYLITELVKNQIPIIENSESIELNYNLIYHIAKTC